MASRLRAFIQLTKPGILRMQLVTLAMGAVVYDVLSLLSFTFLFALIGTALVSASAGVLNHAIEVKYDREMVRTQARPSVTGAVSYWEMWVFGGACGVGGLGVLMGCVNGLTALLAAITLALYLVIYTPMKRVSWLNTYIGAIPGAIPPLGGWASVAGSLSPSAWALFWILFFWQMPHFFALAWMYKADYQRAGFKMLPSVDVSGIKTGVHMIANSLLLSASCIWLWHIEGQSLFFLCVVGVLNFIFGFSVFTYVTSGDVAAHIHLARRVFFYSIAYLPLLLVGLLISKLIA